MSQAMLRWRLTEIMARHQIKVGVLASEMNITQASVSNLRSPEMPRLTGERLNNLLVALNRLSKTGELVTPADLFEFKITDEDLAGVRK